MAKARRGGARNVEDIMADLDDRLETIERRSMEFANEDEPAPPTPGGGGGAKIYCALRDLLDISAPHLHVPVEEKCTILVTFAWDLWMKTSNPAASPGNREAIVDATIPPAPDGPWGSRSPWTKRFYTDSTSAENHHGFSQAVVSATSSFTVRTQILNTGNTVTYSSATCYVTAVVAPWTVDGCGTGTYGAF